MATLQTEVDAAQTRVVLSQLQLALALTQPQQVALGDGALGDLLEEVVERVVAARHEEHVLLGVALVQRRDHLHRHVRLPRARRTLDHRQPLLQTRPDRLHLCGREANGRCRDDRRQREGTVLLVVRRGVRRAHHLLVGEVEAIRRQRLLRLHRHTALVLEAHLRVGEGLLHMSRVHEGVAEVHGATLRDRRVVRRRGIAASQQHVPQPRGQRESRGGLVQQLARGLQHGLEVVLGGVAAHEQVEAVVDALLRVLRLRLHVQLVLDGVEAHGQATQLAGALDALVRLRDVVQPHALLVLHRHHLAAAHAHHALLSQERRVGGLGLLCLLRRLHLGPVLVLVVADTTLAVHHEHHVVLAQRLPLLARLSLQSVQREQDLATHLRGTRLAHARLTHLGQTEGVEWHRHARLSREDGVALEVEAALHRVDHLGQLGVDLGVGLSAVQLEVALEEVLVGEVLQVQRGERQRGGRGLGPQVALCGEEGKRVDGVEGGEGRGVLGGEHLREEAGCVGEGRWREEGCVS